MDEERSALARELLEGFGAFSRTFHAFRHRGFQSGHKPGQLFLMIVLWRRTLHTGLGLRISEIAAALGVTASNVTQLVSELEEKGWVRRSMDRNDRRAVRVSLTSEGEKTLLEARSQKTSSLEGLVDRLGAERAKDLIGLLEESRRYFAEEGGCCFGAHFHATGRRKDLDE